MVNKIIQTEVESAPGDSVMSYQPGPGHDQWWYLTFGFYLKQTFTSDVTNHRVGGTQIETGVDGIAGPELCSNHQLKSGSNEMAARWVLGQIRTT